MAGGGLASPRKGVASPKTQVCRKEAQLQAQGSLTLPCLAEGHTVHLTPPAPHRFRVAGARGTVAIHREVEDQPLLLLAIVLLFGRTGSILSYQKEYFRRNVHTIQGQRS